MKLNVNQIPNALTISRIVSVAVFVVMASIADYIQDPHSASVLRFCAYGLAVLAAATDLLDGYCARKYNVVSDFGKLMDPLADKVFVTATMLLAIEYNLMPAWIAIVVLCREFMVTGLRSLAASRNVIIAADRWGKVKTASQMVMLAIAGFAWAVDGGTDYLRNARIGFYLDDVLFGIRIWHVWLVYLTAVVLITVGSGMNYFIRYRHLFCSSKDK